MNLPVSPWVLWRKSTATMPLSVISYESQQLVHVAITIRHSLLMQPHHFAIAYLCSHPYTKKLYPYIRRKSRVLAIESCAGLHFLWGTRKEVHMEIREVVSFYHLWVKFITLQALLINNTWSFIRDSNKIREYSRVIKRVSSLSWAVP